MTVYSPGGGVPGHVDGAPTKVLLRAQGIPAEELTAAFQALLSTGAPEWRPDEVARLAEGLGWLRGAVALLLGGPRNFKTWKYDFLPKEVRVLLGLTPKEAEMARAFLRDQDPLHLMRILAAGARDPERVVAEGPDVDAIIEDFGLGEDDVRFPEEIVLAAEQEFPYAGARNLEALRSSEELEKSLISTWLWLTTRLRRDDPLRAWLAGRLDDFESGFDPSPYRGIQADLCAPRRRLVAGSAGHRTRDRGGGGGQVRSPGGSGPLLAAAPGSPQPHQQEHRPLERMAEGRTGKGRRSSAGEGPDRAGQACARGTFPVPARRLAGGENPPTCPWSRGSPRSTISRMRPRFFPGCPWWFRWFLSGSFSPTRGDVARREMSPANEQTSPWRPTGSRAIFPRSPDRPAPLLLLPDRRPSHVRCSGRDHLRPHGPGRLAEPVVVGENRGGIESHCRFEVQHLEAPQVWHEQQTRTAVNRPVKSGQPNSVENPGHGNLINALPDRRCAATRFRAGRWKPARPRSGRVTQP